METGAVKQAYNNELIQLKGNLNQARTHIINKLTKKAKQFTEKKGPEAIREKFRRKAESAVKEIMIIKKIKKRDIGKFIITHKGTLEGYLNKPLVDNEKACARILLHKSMQQKYKFIRTRFMNVPIKDLFMSRQERLKLKKEELDKKKEKLKKKKGKVVNAEGDWDVEDVDMKKLESQKEKSKKVITHEDVDGEDISDNDIGKTHEDSSKNVEKLSKEVVSGEEVDGSDGEEDISGEEGDGSDEQDISAAQDQDDQESEHSEQEKNSETDGFESGSDEDNIGEGFKISFKGQSDQESDGEIYQDYDKAKPTGKCVKSSLAVSKNKTKTPTIKESANNIKENKNMHVELPLSIESKIRSIKQSNQKKDSNKNKKLNDKILNKKFKKGKTDTPSIETKVVDPFFITETGENYLSVAEPRAPDEFKEEHRQGNRSIRRAAMFGRVPKIKRRNDFRQNNNNFERQNGFGNNMNNKFESGDRKQDKFQSNDKFNTFNGNKKQRFNDRNEKFDTKTNEDEKPEKLHPSWEAKKKLSSILPFQGKKIVFDES